MPMRKKRSPRTARIESQPTPSLPATNAERLRKGALATMQSIFAARGLDCFATLAMTLMESRRPDGEGGHAIARLPVSLRLDRLPAQD